AEEARLESVYTPKAYPEFESRSLRKKWTESFFKDDRDENEKSSLSLQRLRQQVIASALSERSVERLSVTPQNH
ncbi:MAG: hypothetical protein K2M04_01215, partial [Muribaculaceae bacterium]|nr:hypothetical protein [Muribaculaceae bacterium]